MIKKLTLMTFILSILASPCFAGYKLDKIRIKNKITCGTDLKTKAYAYKDKDGIWHGIDAEMCRILSLALFDTPNKMEIKHVANSKIFEAVEKGYVDVMFGSTPFNASNIILNNVDFPTTLYYTHQGFIARYVEGANSMQSYSNKNVCAARNTIYLDNIRKYNHNYKLGFNILPLSSIQKAKEFFLLGRCDLLTGDIILLKSKLLNENLDDENIVILPESVTRTPVAPMIVNNDKELKEIIRWVINGLILAEEKGINSKNMESFFNSNDEEIKNLLGLKTELWLKLGLNPKWFRKILSTSGNYKELYDRTLGKDSPLKIDRGLNRLWKDGGKITSTSMM